MIERESCVAPAAATSADAFLFYYYYSYSKEDGSSYSRRRVEQTELYLATATGAVRLLRGLSFPDASLSMAT